MSTTNLIDFSKERLSSVKHLINGVDTYEEFLEIKSKIISENTFINDEAKPLNDYDEIIGSDESLIDVMNKIKMVADTDATVLIRGETGTGKELIARRLHYSSNRREKAFIKVNCPAIPSGLIESELFGHEKGSFTGALIKKIGKFALAAGGTIFLDELGDLSLDAQAKLLRVLQEREFETVGGTKTYKVDVRVIAATNGDLEKAVKEGKFRADLYYRLNVFPIDLPSLKNRIEDIPALSNYFLRKYSEKFEKEFENISEETMNKLKSYSWPGNIRELENIIERAVILCNSPVLSLSLEENKKVKLDKDEKRKFVKLVELERNHIVNILNHTGWKVHGSNGAASILDINPSTLRSKMAKLGIKRKSVLCGN